MITIFFYMTVKPDQIDAFRAIVTRAFTTTHAEDVGCITYVFHQQIDNPYEFVLYEQWQDRAALDAHLARLDQTIGWAAILDTCEKTQAVTYDVVT